MKKINIFLGILISVLFFTACTDDWTEEQYEQYISFKAPMNDEGCTPIYVRYKPDGKVRYKLPIIVSGSTFNEKTRHVYVAEDRDTLANINYERFGPNRPEWYYEALEKDKFYTFPEVTEIPAGLSVDSLNIDFALGNIDMSHKWVVPLTIVDDLTYDYKKHPRKNYAKAILRVLPFNDYSGTYSTSTMEVYLRDGDSDKTIGAPMVGNERTAFVVDENTVFFYAGLMNEEMKIEDRQKYKIYVRFLGDGSENDADKRLQIWSENQEEIGFEVKTQDPMYMTAAIPDATRPYLEHRYVSFTIEYNFKDVTSVKADDGQAIPIYYKVKGTLILERNVNTQIPDEDQAIEW